MRLFYALNTLTLADGSAPEWVELLPAGPDIQGRDGRRWTFDGSSALAVNRAFESEGMDMVIDWEHATELKGPAGEEAPAAGWITELETRGGSLWGRVDWTPRAKAQIETREYRYLSPVFSYSKDRSIQVLHSAGLTNNPNLHLTALNRRQKNEEDSMDKKALCRVLGLPETASEAELEKAVADLKAAAEEEKAANSQNTDTPDMTRFVPRGDYDLAMSRVKKAEQQLREHEETEREAKIETAVNSAMAAGKIAPSSRDYYLAACRKEGGLKEFEQFAESAPQVIADPELPDEPKGSEKAMNREEAKVAEMFGNTAEDLAKYTG